MKFAAIDIGSNAVRLVVKSVVTDPVNNSQSLSQDLLVRFPLRLGEDAFVNSEISKTKAKQLLRLIEAYRQMIKIFEITELRTCATSAMRDAKNSEKIVKKIHDKTGIKIEIINGEEEAHIIYDTHIEQLLDKGRNYLYMDVGGGSTQLTLIHDGKLVYSHSFNIGTVRMMNDIVSPKEKAAFRKKLKELCEKYPEIHLIGSGGNINKLNKLAQNQANKDIMSVKALKTLNEELSKLSVEARMKKYKIKRDRAEVIGFASELFLEAAGVVKTDEIIIPAISISDGIINKMFIKKFN
jgi:exopolyphosphatase/guanosine-5'-triphosphate,3'-diphosphate pyrophosphatase